MLSLKLREMFRAEEVSGMDSDEFRRCFRSAKFAFNRESKNAVGTDHGQVYAVELTEDRKNDIRIIISVHAIDRASQRCQKQWKRYGKKDEGLASWLHRMAMNWMRLQDKIVGPGFHKAWKGMRFAFAYNGMDSTGKLTFTMTTIVEANK